MYVLNRRTGEIKVLKSKITLLAAGGIGQAYLNTTNPKVATGDGIAMAYRAKAIIKNMEFVQFHPTALYQPNVSPSFLISEAVRGAGGILRNHNNEPFMEQYDKRKDLAPRDVVARAIDAEMKKHVTTNMLLDVSHIEKTFFIAHFPTIYNKCVEIGLEISKDYIPVVPAAHYLCGGIEVATNARTSITNLYASGECAFTGLHGANRLASNSLIEALVYSHNAFLDSIEQVENIEFQENIPEWNDEGTSIPKEHILIQHNLERLQHLMRDYVGIVRSNSRLTKAAQHLDLIYQEVEELYKSTKINTGLCELRNMVNVAHLIIRQSLERKQNKGGYYNLNNVYTKADNPLKDLL